VAIVIAVADGVAVRAAAGDSSLVSAGRGVGDARLGAPSRRAAVTMRTSMMRAAAAETPMSAATKYRFRREPGGRVCGQYSIAAEPIVPLLATLEGSWPGRRPCDSIATGLWLLG